MECEFVARRDGVGGEGWAWLGVVFRGGGEGVMRGPGVLGVSSSPLPLLLLAQYGHGNTHHW